jgi:hypothetical protein
MRRAADQLLLLLTTTEMLLPRIPWSGKAATKGYWKCHGRKHTENTEIFCHEFHEFTPKLVEFVAKSFPCSPCKIPWQKIFASVREI